MSIFKKKDQNNGAEQPVKPEAVQLPEKKEVEPEIAAVIALAMHLYDLQMREDENAIITIQRIMKPYSPWNSKIYGLRQQPLRIPGLRTRIK